MIRSFENEKKTSSCNLNLLESCLKANRTTRTEIFHEENVLKTFA